MSTEETTGTRTLLVCVDGSAYADAACTFAGWMAQRLNAAVHILHVLRRHSDYEAPHDDHTGSIGLGARSGLLEELTRVDEERGRLDQQKGRLILEHGKQLVAAAGIEQIQLIHRRGSLTETIQEFENDVELIVIGKRGEHADPGSAFLGSNLEKTARAVHKPLLVVPLTVQPPRQRFLLAYDGHAGADKAIDYLVESPLLHGLHCHLLAVDSSGASIDTSGPEQRLRSAGYELTVSHETDGHADQVITAYVVEKEIELLVTGAYSHSRMRSILLGSTTASLIKACKIPMLLFR